MRDIVWTRLKGGQAQAGASPRKGGGAVDVSKFGARLHREIGADWSPGTTLRVLELPDDLLPAPAALSVHLYEPSILLPDGSPQRTLPGPRTHAIVRYGVGLSGSLRVDCDWSGSLPLVAHRLLTVDLVTDYFVAGDSGGRGSVLDVSVGVVIGERAPTLPPTYTLARSAVEPDATLDLPVPALARALRCHYVYGVTEGAPADPPLGQWLFAFAIGDTTLGWIDAASVREPLFGAGVWLPPGVERVVFSNRSADAIGVLPQFVLGL